MDARDGATRLDPTLAEQHFVSDMSADGARIVGYRRLNASGPETVAAIWDRATGQRLDLGVLPGDVSSLARHISGDGSTVIGVSQSPSGDVRAFRWSGATGMQFLGTLGGGFSAPTGLSFFGSTIVGSSTNSGGQSRPFIWTQSTGMQQIPGLTAESYALGISSDGQSVLGRSLGSSWSAGLFFYRASAGLFDVDLNGGQFNFSMPANITADGTAAYGSAFFPIAGTTTFDTTAFVWRFGTGVSILDPAQSPVLLDMSGDGELGVGYEIDASGFRRPLRWTQATGITTLAAPAPGFSLTQASVVSEDGSCTFGYGPLGSDVAHGLRWQTDATIGDSYCDATTPNSAGQLGTLILTGSNSIQAGALTLDASGIPPGNFGFFLVSPDQDFVTPVTNSQGTLCLGAGIGRFIGPGQVGQASGAGTISLTVDPANMPGPSGFFTPNYGQSLYFQAWYRDANPGLTSNFTPAATVRFY